jgi:hypothetical protein
MTAVNTSLRGFVVRGYREDGGVPMRSLGDVEAALGLLRGAWQKELLARNPDRMVEIEGAVYVDDRVLSAALVNQSLRCREMSRMLE